MKERAKFQKFSSTTNLRYRWVFPSPFNLDNCTVNCTTETEGIYREKAPINPLVSRWSVPFNFSFCGGNTRFTDAIAANKRANSHNFKIKKNWIYSQLLSSRFTEVTEVNLRTWMNRRWEWIILPVRSLNVLMKIFTEVLHVQVHWLPYMVKEYPLITRSKCVLGLFSSVL